MKLLKAMAGRPRWAAAAMGSAGMSAMTASAFTFLRKSISPASSVSRAARSASHASAVAPRSCVRLSPCTMPVSRRIDEVSCDLPSRADATNQGATGVRT
ncbi:MAG: hypothetical protein EB084_14395 [Proteobacteria bacterium]|nr:hypothetical protein [Pseudomonadota bacterium]